jgi:transposase
MTLTAYQNFIGIDIGKFELSLAVHGAKQSHIYKNDQAGWKALHKDFKAQFKGALVILETTGGHELGLILYLQKLKIKVHRANTRQVKNFIRSLGQQAKTDHLDALALARYGQERHESLSLFEASKEAFQLYELAQRRLDLKKILVQEKNRIKAPRMEELVKKSCEQVIALLEKQTQEMDAHLQGLIDRNPLLKERQKVLETIEGIGPITARSLLCFMPELGSLNHKQVASLAGLAPYANESGMYKGQRRIRGGRQEVRNALFMAAMAARLSNSRFKAFYLSLIEKGKKPMVALTALMRKLLVVANARIKEMLNASALKGAEGIAT